MWVAIDRNGKIRKQDVGVPRNVDMTEYALKGKKEMDR